MAHGFSCKRIYKVKIASDGSKGFQQRRGVSYATTFAPMARIDTVWLLLAIAAHFNLHLDQLDFDTSFLNSFHDKAVVM